MAARLTDRQKKKIIADYVELGSYNAVAKKHGITHQTVKRVVMDDTEITQKAQQKKEENTADILAYMEAKRDKVCEIMDVYLDALLNEEKVERAKLSELTTALGTLIDKFTGNGRGIGDHQEADGLSRSLEEMAKGLKSDAE